MREEQAQQVLTVMAFEEADRDQLLLTARGRSTATRKAFEGANIEEANSPEASETVIVRRAALLVNALQEQVPYLSGIFHLTRLVNWPVPAAVVISLVIGLMTNALGFQRHINLLSFPLFILLAWNLGFYLVHGLLLIARPWAGHRSPSGGLSGTLHSAGNIFTKARRQNRRLSLRPLPALGHSGSGMLVPCSAPACVVHFIWELYP
jgi:hypothetical protein